MKNDNFFKHDATAADDEKILLLIEREGLKGYGAYWILIEALRKQDNLCSSFSVLRSLAIRSRVRQSYLVHIVKDFGLFVIEGDHFYSPGMKRRMAKYLLGAAYQSVKQSVKEEDNTLIDNANVAIHTRETEQNRKEKILSVVDMGAIEGQQPVCPYQKWESLVDEMAASEDYMNQAGMHSGLGKLFISNEKYIVQLFKNQICLQGKQDRMMNLGEVKSYFSNFVANGSVTNKKIRVALEYEMSQQNKRNGRYAYRYEQLVDGKRMYLGHEIPDDAPPRPNSSAVWDEVKKKWGS